MLRDMHQIQYPMNVETPSLTDIWECKKQHTEISIKVRSHCYDILQNFFHKVWIPMEYGWIKEKINTWDKHLSENTKPFNSLS